MKNEMDIMSMDERQRYSWLQANRITLFCVGVVWIGLIVCELIRGGTPYFMIAMVPVLAGVRLLLYRYFIRT